MITLKYRLDKQKQNVFLPLISSLQQIPKFFFSHDCTFPLIPHCFLRLKILTKEYALTYQAEVGMIPLHLQIHFSSFISEYFRLLYFFSFHSSFCFNIPIILHNTNTHTHTHTCIQYATLCGTALSHSFIHFNHSILHLTYSLDAICLDS